MARQLTPLGRILHRALRPRPRRLRALPLRRARRRSPPSWPPTRRRRARSRRTTSAAARGPAPRPTRLGARTARPRRAARGSAGRSRSPSCTWGGYAGGIVANDGFAPNKESRLLQGLRHRGGAPGDRRLREVARRLPGRRRQGRRRHHVVDGRRLRPRVRRPAASSTPRPSCSTTGAAAATPSRWTPRSRAWPTCKGKKLACAEATPSHYFALYVLTQGGLTNRDVEWVFTDLGRGRGQRLQGGQGRRGRLLVARRLRRGPRARGRRTSWPPPRRPRNLIADIFVARGDFLEQHPEDVAPLRGRLAQGRRHGQRRTRTRRPLLLRQELLGDRPRGREGHARRT